MPYKIYSDTNPTPAFSPDIAQIVQEFIAILKKPAEIESNRGEQERAASFQEYATLAEQLLCSTLPALRDMRAVRQYTIKEQQAILLITNAMSSFTIQYFDAVTREKETDQAKEARTMQDKICNAPDPGSMDMDIHDYIIRSLAPLKKLTDGHSLPDGLAGKIIEYTDVSEQLLCRTLPALTNIRVTKTYTREETLSIMDLTIALTNYMNLYLKSLLKKEEPPAKAAEPAH